MATSKNIRVTTSVVAILAGLGAGFPAQAMNMEGLLEKLRDKGVLSEEEFQEMRQEAREARRAEALEKASAKDVKEKAKVKVTGDDFKDRFTFSTPDGEASIRLTGRVHADYRVADNDLSLNSNAANDRDSATVADGFELRRARIGFNGFVYRDVGFEAIFNGVGSAPTVDTAFINLGWYKPAQLRFGRFKQPFNLEEQTSSNEIDFAERSYVNQLAPGKKLGAMLHGIPFGKDGLYYGASVFQEGFSEESQSDGDGKRYAGRLTADFAKLAAIPDTVIHLGVGGIGGDYQVRPGQSSQTSSNFETTTRATVLGFRSLNRGMSNIYRAQIAGADIANINCGTAGATAVTGCTQPRAGLAGENTVDVENNIVGLEAAFARGPFKVQGEWVRSDLDAINPVVSTGDTQQRVKGDVRAYYVQAVWNITGEKWSDGYKEGRFGGLKVANPFRPGGGWGAFQIGVRYSAFDASDLRVAGSGSRLQSGATSTQTGTAAAFNTARSPNDDVHSYGIGLNWYPNPMTRVMLEWTRTDFGTATVPLDVSTAAGTRGINKEDIFSIRTQLNF